MSNCFKTFLTQIHNFLYNLISFYNISNISNINHKKLKDLYVLRDISYIKIRMKKEEVHTKATL